jgi:transglutaminase-like putative cysteine protease
MLFQAIPFAVVLFVLFPRINGPLWGLPEDAFSATTGLSDQMSPGRLSQLSNNPDVAFRVEFESTIPSRANLYWRGPVLWNFDGYNWTAPEHERTELNSFSFTALNDVIKYSVTLQPHNKFWIFALDLPADLPVGTVLSADMQILSVLPVQKLQRFNLSSYTRYVLPRTAKLSLDRYLKLPDSAGSSFGKPPLSKSRALIHQLKDSSSQLNTVDNVLNYFATQNFFYTRQPPILHDDPVDEFLFESKRGYCEHYASSFTVLMRLAGIPARVVTGYQGGELNPVDNFMTIRQSDAHAWAEVYLADNGWVRIDPTSAIPPGNIENSKDALRLNSNLKKPDHLFQSNWLSKQIKQVRFGWDAVNNRWNQWVLGYNNIKQKALFEAIGIPEISWQGLSQLLFGILAVLTGLLALIVFSTQHKSKDELQKAYFTFLKKIKKHGLVKSIHEGEGDFSLRAVKQLPEHKKSIEKITLLYQQLRYKKHHVKTLVLFKNYIKAFKP